MSSRSACGLDVLSLSSGSLGTLSEFRHFLETPQSLPWQPQPLPNISAYDRDLVRTLGSWLLAKEGESCLERSLGFRASRAD